jgi:hypothetical protein
LAVETEDQYQHYLGTIMPEQFSPTCQEKGLAEKGNVRVGSEVGFTQRLTKYWGDQASTSSSTGAIRICVIFMKLAFQVSI